jgi:formiminotetrahydrofolate cyclodeaminase
MLGDFTVREFLTVLASDRPTPGGGGAAAVSGALGAALVGMACRLSLGKKTCVAVEPLMRLTAERSTALGQELLDLADQDAAAFAALMAGYKLEASAEKSAKLAELLQAAAEVPWQIALACAQILVLAAEVAGKSNKNLDSDLRCAAEMAQAGLNSGIVNVEVNLALMEPGAYVAEKRRAIQALMEEAAAARERVEAGLNA